MKSLGELLRAIAAASFIAFVVMTLIPPSADPMNMRSTFVWTFWILAIASMLFRRSDDLPLFAMVAITSLLLVFSGHRSIFSSVLLFSLVICSISILLNGALRNDLSDRTTYAWGALAGIPILSARLVYDIYTDNRVWVVEGWLWNTTRASLSDDVTFLILYTVIAISTAAMLYWGWLIELISEELTK